MTLRQLPQIIDLPYHSSDRGVLTILHQDNFPFDVRRSFIVDVLKTGERRGNHAHLLTKQFIIPLNGSFKVYLTGTDGEEYTYSLLYGTSKGIYIPNFYWTVIEAIEQDLDNHIFIVLTSEEYDPSDYIRDKESFLQYANSV